jgi:hypothetical protein
VRQDGNDPHRSNQSCMTVASVTEGEHSLLFVPKCDYYGNAPSSMKAKTGSRRGFPFDCAGACPCPATGRRGRPAAYYDSVILAACPPLAARAVPVCLIPRAAPLRRGAGSAMPRRDKPAADALIFAHRGAINGRCAHRQAECPLCSCIECTAAARNSGAVLAPSGGGLCVWHEWRRW